ncbi:estradiol 17-beta-dehydrogenase 11-like [Cylas formicarius]|uniref:estradiol 17-beta-dehydrogenase 11-like n=1 Tax=Cylas formicarius TaxID=197179 RepID=UPI0029584357|nr:estradiol 17-beta-dehydrogenase 11-like [Cylas formicarius]XP_060523278.1 estradiol 17-beta-dehydrogenase 11-like [Cylas formicarius]XP_060523279.1 estradiol 17-beta-dehydrogenase 11-like [Cylas formicarius]
MSYDRNGHFSKNMRPIREPKLLKSTVDVIGFLIISALHILRAIYKFFLPKRYKTLKDLRGEVALVTGGGGGLGRLLALRLGKLGATVVVWDVNVSGVEETVSLVKGIGGIAYGYKCDLADKDDVYRVAKKTQQEVGDVTLLINNAGVAVGNLLLDTPDHLIKRTFDVNVIAHFWTVKAFLPKMIKNKHGHIVTVASMAGHVGINKLVDYCSSKFAAVGFDEALRVELEAQGVKGVLTTAVCPYFIQQTGMFDTVDSRFLPRLKPNDVADRIIEGIRSNEVMVVIPGVMRFGLVLKSIIPWTVLSTFLRGLVPDAGPHSPSVINTDSEEEELITNLDNVKLNGNSLTETVSKLSRNSPIGKNP